MRHPTHESVARNPLTGTLESRVRTTAPGRVRMGAHGARPRANGGRLAQPPVRVRRVVDLPGAGSGTRRPATGMAVVLPCSARENACAVSAAADQLSNLARHVDGGQPRSSGRKKALARWPAQRGTAEEPLPEVQQVLVVLVGVPAAHALEAFNRERVLNPCSRELQAFRRHRPDAVVCDRTQVPCSGNQRWVLDQMVIAKTTAWSLVIA